MIKKKAGKYKIWKVQALVRHIENSRSNAEFRNLVKELRTREIPELFEAAELLRRYAEDRSSFSPYWDCVYELRKRESQEVFDTSMQLCKSRRVRDRQLGCFILGDDVRPKRQNNRGAVDQLHNMLKTETNPTVLYAILCGLGRAQDPDDTREIKRIASFRAHVSAKVRLGVVHSLFLRSDRTSVTTLIHLSRDKNVDVRDWATFYLGFESSGDTPRIRKALLNRLDDEDCDTRCEALVSLARRKEPLVREAIIRELSLTSPTTMAFEAAADFEDKSLLPLIDRQIASADENTDESWLKEAREAKYRLETGEYPQD
ncbi:MAG: hypothetical protein GKS02_00385 [Alphaproteobacteria bacterium]|nr:hypothetical protein [Alphaproteobacteria bacterium]